MLLLALSLPACSPRLSGTVTPLPGMTYAPGAAAQNENPGARSNPGQGQPSLTPSRTPTQTLTPTPSPSPTPTPAPAFNVFIQTCDTGIDVFNGMGEVTNAYVTVQNVGNREATGVAITLQANDEERVHPDKSYQVDHLPAGYEISVKLTVDTKNATDTIITANASSPQGITATASKTSCKARRPDQDILNKIGELYQVKKITTSTNP